MSYSIEPVGVMHSCFKERFGIPCQPGLARAARGRIEFFPPYDRAEAFAGLEGFSHLWVVFLFHKSFENEPSLTVRPPRQEGKRFGVFATRAPNRPNQLGQSVVTLERIEETRGKISLHVKGVDLIDGTPIVDVKPYVPYVDSIEDAAGGFAHQAPGQRWQVSFSSDADQQVDEYEQQYPELRQLITDVLQYDPRPVYYRKGTIQKTQFGVRLYDLDVRFEVVEEGRVTVYELVELSR